MGRWEGAGKQRTGRCAQVCLGSGGGSGGSKVSLLASALKDFERRRVSFNFSFQKKILHVQFQRQGGRCILGDQYLGAPWGGPDPVTGLRLGGLLLQG